MKDQHNENSHPVDQYFLQQSELLEIQYNPKHWQQLSDQLAGHTIADAASDNNEEDIPKAAPPKQSWLLLGILFLLLSTTLLWQLYSAKSMGNIQEKEKTSIYPAGTGENTSDLTTESAAPMTDDYSTDVVPTQSGSLTKAEMTQQRRSAITQPLETNALPVEIKSISVKTRPLVVPLDDKAGEKKEVFIFW